MSYLIIIGKKNQFLLNGKLPWEFNFFQTDGKTRQEKRDETRRNETKRNETRRDITTRNGIAR